MATYFTSVMLALALIAPSLPQETQDSAPEVQPQETESAAAAAVEAPQPPPLTIEEYAAEEAREAGIHPEKFRRLIICESRGKRDAVGDNGTSFGILQFKQATFAHFSKKYAMSDADIENPRHQIDLATQMIRDGRLGHWRNCARKIGWN